MSKFEKFATTMFFVVALIGTDKGWLPGFWAVVCALIGCVGLEKWILSRHKEES